MSNSFYSDFDFQVCGEHGNRPDDYRTPFQVDRDRVIYSSAFRQLQSKTQVFLSGEYDFYRTRLTHSLEVAQIGRSICQYLRSYSGTPLSDGFHIDADLVEAVCLSHDLGHPPFGHAGERTLHTLMRDSGGFEGNAQTLRLLTSIIYLNEHSGSKGMAPTRAFLDGVLKYKTLLSEDPEAENHFIYDDQVPFREFVFDSANLPDGLTPGDTLNTFRSIECQIMDWADDTAYSLNDIIDGVRAGFLAFEKMDKWAEQAKLDEESSAWMAELKRSITRDTLEAVFSKKIGECIRACRIVESDTALSKKTTRHAFKLEIDEGVRRQVTFYKNMANDLIFASPQLAQMEHNGRFILRGLFDAMHENYIGRGSESIALVTRAIDNLIKAESSTEGKTRRICDYLAGLTDSAARRIWKRLFDPNSASIKELG